MNTDTDTDSTDEPNKGGRPPFYDTPEAIQLKIDEYFEDCKLLRETSYIDNKRNLVKAMLPHVPTINGLALFLGFASERSLRDYTDRNEGKEEFAPIIARAKSMCFEDLNQRALADTVNANIAARNMAANHGLNEKATMELTGPGGTPLGGITVTFVKGGAGQLEEPQPQIEDKSDESDDGRG